MIDFEPYLNDSHPPEIPLPEGWPDLALAAVLHVIAVARLAIMSAQCWPGGGACSELRLRAENDRLRSEIELLKQELSIKDSRFAMIDPRHRPRYTPRQRLAILVLKSARGWNTAQVAKRFHVTTQTIRNWMRFSTSLVELPEKVTRYPDYLRLIIQQLKGWSPTLGRRKIADILARTGLHISASTVRRIIDEPPIDPEMLESPDEPNDGPTEESSEKSRTVIAKYANHVWSVDLTLVPIDQGFWVPWSPNSLPQRHPYCWHVCVRSANSTGASHSAAEYARLKDFYRQAEKYGTGGIKQLENGRYRFYGELDPADVPGEMVGRIKVREWDPVTGNKRTWFETSDGQGTVRIVRPETGGPKVHYIFDAEGNYVGTR